ncbi:hypothetical protein [Kribbella sp. CA-293567]|uniref:hypothetical protein n=1 Tax=Kribbella sp. CA-293567 TaxID=3002436 RepID=UPI0022DE6BAD|nr:hypothetical protein [Kribbella sp. CA-293567]WBQ02992.1 hypothetical protein OX958_23780 [Kribbella sp. CA-293567]
MTALTPTLLSLLKELRLRETPPGGPCWLVWAERNRYALFVSSFKGEYTRQRHVAASTLRKLHAAGLIQYSADVKMPDWFNRREGDAAVGCTITLTEAGQAASGGAQ